jgi:hypothetical protein
MNTPFKTAFGKTIGRHGFRKQSDTWYLDCPETILVANLQRSDYSEKYYINFGVWVKAIDESVVPKENHCHIRIRLGRLGGDSLGQALDMNLPEVDQVERGGDHCDRDRS